MFQSSSRKIGTCEACNAENIVITAHYNNMWFCDGCWEKELQAKKETIVTEPQPTTSDKINNTIRESRKTDTSLKVLGDMFNAETTAIVELKKAIDNDESIANKPFALAEEILARIEHDKNIITEASEALLQASNRQRAAQVYLNQLANQLREDERKKLRIADISYKPSAPKPIKTKSIRTSKIDKVELRKYASELGVSEITLQMVVVQKGITVEAAANLLRRSIREAQSEAS